MKRTILIAVATLTLSATIAPAAPGREAYRGDDYRRDDNRRDDYRREDRHRHDDHNPRERRERYIVHFHLDGGSRREQAKSHDRAYRIERFLCSVGADAHVDRRRVVHYRMRGERQIERYSHEDAHRLAQKLQGYGFHAHVDHE